MPIVVYALLDFEYLPTFLEKYPLTYKLGLEGKPLLFIYFII